MKREPKKIPKFKDENTERAFWAGHDSVDYIDWGKAKRTAFPNLKPTTKSISLRLPISLLGRLKIAANKRDVPYQSYAKILLASGVKGGITHE